MEVEKTIYEERIVRYEDEERDEVYEKYLGKESDWHIVASAPKLRSFDDGELKPARLIVRRPLQNSDENITNNSE